MLEELPRQVLGAPSRRSTVVQVAPLLAVVAAVGFVVGVGFGGRLSGGPTPSSSAESSVAPSVVASSTLASPSGGTPQPVEPVAHLNGGTPAPGAIVDVTLAAAYDRLASSGWAACTLEIEVRCRPLIVTVDVDLTDGRDAPVVLTDGAWTALDPTTIDRALMVLVVPLGGISPLAGSDPTLRLVPVGDPSRSRTIDIPSSTWQGAVWAALGTPPAGRYLVVASSVVVNLALDRSNLVHRRVYAALAIEVR